MKNIVLIKKVILLGVFASFVGCLDDDLADVGDLEDTTGPTPFFTSTDVSASQFDCSEVLLDAEYYYQVEAGTNLGVNGTEFLWTVEPATDIGFINSQLPILETQIEALQPDVVAWQEEIDDLEFEIPCEEDAARKIVLEETLERSRDSLDKYIGLLDDSVLEQIATLESEIDNLDDGTAEDRDVIITFPDFGTYDVTLQVTDNLGVSDIITQRLILNVPVPTIPVPEIGEPSFEEKSLFDGSGDGRDSWRVPSNDPWSPVGGGTTVIQINTSSSVPDGGKAAKFPASGERIAYQEIEVTPDVNFLLSYSTEFDGTQADNGPAAINFYVVKGDAENFTEAITEDFTIASKVVTNDDTVDGVFARQTLGFNSGENESVILLIWSSGVETRVDDVQIVVNQ